MQLADASAKARKGGGRVAVRILERVGTVIAQLCTNDANNVTIKEFAPVCAVAGGLVAQEALRVRHAALLSVPALSLPALPPHQAAVAGVLTMIV
jgi:hypothetical protein